jgi:acyl-CoA synthetase (AMP-forming)/AMP-acid ligase II
VTVGSICPSLDLLIRSSDAYFGVLAARGIVTAINIRLTAPEVSYILQHSGSKLILVDREFTHLVKGTKIPMIVCHDTGRIGDPYEEFLKAGRRFGAERGWLGFDVEADEDASAVLCYTYAPLFGGSLFTPNFICICSSGTTGRARLTPFLYVLGIG